MVNTYVEGTCMEGEAEAIASLHEGILHPLRHSAVEVGERSVVEVSTDDHTSLLAMLLDEVL